MLPSMFNLDHHLAELRPTPDEERLARYREATAPVTRITRMVGGVARDRTGAVGIRARRRAARLPDPRSVPAHRSTGVRKVGLEPTYEEAAAALADAGRPTSRTSWPDNAAATASAPPPSAAGRHASRLPESPSGTRRQLAHP